MKTKLPVLALLLAVCFALAGCAQGDAALYSQAQKLLSGGEYEKAVAAFNDLGEYEDSAKFSLYALAQQQLSGGEFDKAVTNFQNLDGFKNSALFLRYAAACRQQAQGEYAQAAEAYRALGDFHDSTARAAQAQFAYARALETAGDLATAIAAYQALGDTPQALERIEACRQAIYTAAGQALGMGKHWEAYEAFLSLGDYRDAAQKAKEAQENLALFAAKDEKTGLWGFMDASLTFVIQPMFDRVDYSLTSLYVSHAAFETGLEVVSRDQKYGVIDKTGKWVLPNTWKYVVPYTTRGVYAVQDEQSKYGLIDAKGEYIINPEWDGLSLLSEEPELYTVKKNGLYGIIDRQGKEILPLQEYEINFYQDSSELQEGLVQTIRWDSSYNLYQGLLSLDRLVSIPPEWDNLFLPKDGLCVAKKGGFYGFINTAGEEVIPLEWDDASHFADGLVMVKKGDAYQLLDLAGNALPSLNGEKILRLTDTLFAVRQKEAYTLMDRSGQSVSGMVWEDISRLSDTLFAAKKDGLWGIIDPEERVVLPFEWDEISISPPTEESVALAVAGKGHTFWFVDQKGALAGGQAYGHIARQSEGLYCVMKDGKFGYLDGQLNTVIPLMYDSAMPFFQGLANVSQGGLWGRIDAAGEVKTPLLFTFYELIDQMEQEGPYSRYTYLLYEGNTYIPADVYKLRQGDKYFLMNMKEEKISAAAWDFLTFYPGGIVAVREGKGGLLDYQGREVLPPVYDVLNFVSDDVLVCEKGGTPGIVDLQGNEVSFPGCKNITFLSPLILGSTGFNAEHYLYDISGKEITFDGLQIETADGFREGLAFVSLKDTVSDTDYQGYINTSGEIVIRWETPF